MPSLNSRAVQTPTNFVRKAASQPGAPTPIQNAPEIPNYLQRNTAMISSLPSIANTLDGASRQFYGAGNLPYRRVTLP
jgi:chitinase